MKNFSLHWLPVLLTMLGPWCARSWADGGQVRLVEQRGSYRVSIFTSPNPLRAGPVDISVLLQDATTSQPVEEAHIFVEVTEKNDAGFSIRAPATTAAATNKLLRAALIELPRPGLWNVKVHCLTRDERADVEFAMEAGSPLPRWLSVWPAFTWPIGIILIFATHRFLVARQRHVSRSALLGRSGHPIVEEIVNRQQRGSESTG